MKRYYSMEQMGDCAEIYIYGDITSWPWLESDVSAYLLSRKIEALQAAEIRVYINSYGGEVSEALAIYNALRRNPARVVTCCDGFACSAASLVFMAGDDRMMNEASLLMIHNAWENVSGNAKELRKAADDLEKISETAANIYRTAVKIDAERLDALLDAETWMTPMEAMEMGFATGIEAEQSNLLPAANARKSAYERVARNPVAGQLQPEKLREIIAELLEPIKTQLEKQQVSANTQKQESENKPLKLLNALCAENRR